MSVTATVKIEPCDGETEENSIHGGETVKNDQSAKQPDNCIAIKNEPIDFSVSVRVEPIKLEPLNLEVVKTEPGEVESVKVEPDLYLAESKDDHALPPRDSFDYNNEPEEILPDNIQGVSKVQKPCSQQTINIDGELSKYLTADQKFKCPVCKKVLKKKCRFTEHLKIHHRPVFQCNVCKKTFKKQGFYDKHIVIHAMDKFKCEECNKEYKTLASFQQHRRLHLVKPFRCDICLRPYETMELVKKHRDKNLCHKSARKPLKCDHCDKVFYQSFFYKSHIRSHSVGKPFQCDYCKMFFKYKTSLARHINIHDDARKIACPICDKRFNHYASLKPHMRSHTGERPYVCETCLKAFGSKQTLKNHMRTHEKEKNLVCNFCSRRFPRESRLIYHMRSHTTAQPFQCQICPRKFTHKQNVIRHYQRKHPNDSFASDFSEARFAYELYKEIQEKQIPIVQKKVHEKFVEKQRQLNKVPEAVVIKASDESQSELKPIEEVIIKVEIEEYPEQ